MDGDVFVTIPVSPAAAELLRDERRARAMGELVSQLLKPDSREVDPLSALIRRAAGHDPRLPGAKRQEVSGTDPRCWCDDDRPE